MDDIILDALNDEQRAAATLTEGHIRVVAGAGSGKTRALTHRYAYLAEVLGVSPSCIACLTFTNKAAIEMKQRVRRMIGEKDTGFLCTFHGLALQILKEDIYLLGYPKSFRVLDAVDQRDILKSVYEDMGLSLRDEKVKQMLDNIAMYKCRHRDYVINMTAKDDAPLRDAALSEKERRRAIILRYMYEEKKLYALDFDDLILFALHLLNNREDVRLKWQKKFEYVMIDEFQDVDPEQYELARILSAYHNNLFAVGDPDQTIYTWRGASVRTILDFDKVYPDAQTLVMNRNYRSVPTVTAVANSLISRNRERVNKRLAPMREGGSPVLYCHAATVRKEAEWISDEIKKLLDSGAAYNDIAVLYRAHYVSRSIEDVFCERQIPYTIFSGVEFYSRAEVKDALCYLCMTVYADDMSFIRTVNAPKRKIGRKRLAFLKDYQAKNGGSLFAALVSNADDELFRGTEADEYINLIQKYRRLQAEMKLSELLPAMLNDSGYKKYLEGMGDQERLDNLAELIQSVTEFELTSGEECSASDYLERVAIFTRNDVGDKRSTVAMMTLHNSKGMEFPYVFICGLSEGISPSSKVTSVEDMEEERRLVYVGVTRARDGLYLSDAEGLSHGGQPRTPSRFITDVDSKLITFVNGFSPSPRSVNILSAPHRDADMPSATRFAAGDRVGHPVFGDGVVLSVNNIERCIEIQFDSRPTPRSLSFNAPLTYL